MASTLSATNDVVNAINATNSNIPGCFCVRVFLLKIKCTPKPGQTSYKGQAFYPFAKKQSREKEMTPIT
jgi:hypothetical protein